MARAPIQERPSRIFRQSPRFRAEAERLGANVRALRKNRAWTLEQAAELAHLDLKHLQKVEAGALNVTLVTLVRLAEGFDIQLDDLFAQKPISAGPTPGTSSRGKRQPATGTDE